MANISNELANLEIIRGELVPQDPNDEPASELLKRIQAERAGNASGKKGLRNDR